MHALMDELRNGLMVDWAQLVRIAVRLLLSAGLGAVVGLQREQTGKPAGLRTHMLVALGATLFVLAPLEMDVSMSDIGRVIQGVATGIGFIGGGAILKLSAEREVRGLTSAAGIWITAAAGVAVGLGRLAIAALSILLTWIILAIIGRAERRIEKNRGL
ncbi:MAG TPA: MgtC/SapB family protein [Candidatus Eisenbacteria bacterium]|jgi:putative Mg2+ transporter-C (MgtC) family protein|nr:MgtC/SapB family protein [Candidatus Eisenbacteria bacterium]